MAAQSENTTRTQFLSCSFTVPGRHSTTMRVTVRPNEDPAASGSCLIFPEQPIDTFVDFPICSATLEASVDYGYAATYGWIQMVLEMPLNSESTTNNNPATWEMDPIPITAALNTPFMWFGPKPRLYDAPFRINRTDMDWTCWSFLTYIKDSLMSQAVRPVLAIEWGFRIESGIITIKTLRLVDVHEAWEQQRNLMEKNFSGWTFEPVDKDLIVGNAGQTE